MAITISGSGITSANIADGTITTDDILASDVKNLKSGRKNLIINGGFDVWQRGTSFTLTTSGYHTDRFRGRDGTFSRSTDVPPGEGFAYSVFYDNDGTRESINMRQAIENGKRLTDGKELTLSFWAKGSVNTTCSVDFGDTQNTTWNLTTSWNRVVVSVPAHADRNHNNLFSGGLFVDFNFYEDYPDVYITGVQLELGSVATDFEHRSYGEELALCQRYYCTMSTRIQNSMKATGSTTGRALINITHPVTMRASPTVAFTDGAGTSNRATYHSSNLGNGANHGQTIYYSIGSDFGTVIVVNAYTGYDCYIDNYTADAEL
jgi:hypothetical protein